MAAGIRAARVIVEGPAERDCGARSGRRDNGHDPRPVQAGQCRRRGADHRRRGTSRGSVAARFRAILGNRSVTVVAPGQSRAREKQLPDRTESHGQGYSHIFTLRRLLDAAVVGLCALGFFAGESSWRSPYAGYTANSGTPAVRLVQMLPRNCSGGKFIRAAAPPADQCGTLALPARSRRESPHLRGRRRPAPGFPDHWAGSRTETI